MYPPADTTNANADPPQQLTPEQVQQRQNAEEGGYRGNHPVAAFFHIIFKIFSVFFFMLGKTMGMSFVSVFICVALLHAADFWTVKNVSGRLMVRLRWWNSIREDGESEWKFESHPNAKDVHAFDSYFFWIVTYGITGLWILLAVLSLTSLSYIPLSLLGIVLTGANALGYTKCRRDAKKKLAQFVMQHPGMVAAAVR